MFQRGDINRLDENMGDNKKILFTKLGYRKYEGGGKIRRLKSILPSTTKEPPSIFIDLDTGGLGYNLAELEALDRTLDTIPAIRRDAILATAIAESGVNPYAVGDNGQAKGYLQWHPNRWPFTDSLPRKEERERQGRLIGESLTDVKQWHHGGTGSGYNTAAEAQRAFYGNDPDNVLRALTLGYVRPKGRLNSYIRRKRIYDQLQSKRKSESKK